MTNGKRTPRLDVPEQLSQLMMAIATGQPDGKILTEDGRDLAAVLMGRRGGLKGGKARAEVLSSERRSEIARAAAKKRWGGKDG